jgi:S-adenosylmethionine-dependent methyltransferase
MKDFLDDVSDIAAYYSNDPEKEHTRLDQHQLENDLTWRYLNQYLPPQGSILEIGCATGRYTLELARRGYTLTSVDLSATLLAECKRNLARAGLEKRVLLVEADVRDLSQITEDDFDAVLLMGPLYHLVEQEDRKGALRQVFERLRKDGIIFSAFISRYGIMGDVMKDIPEWIEDQKAVKSHLKKGRRPTDYPRGGFRGYFAKVSEIAPLHEMIGFETLVLAGVEPAISADDQSYNQLQGKQRQLWFDLLFEISTEETLIGASRHLLYIGKKE